MKKWKMVNKDGVQVGIAENGCNSPFVVVYFTDAETIVEKHNGDCEEVGAQRDFETDNGS
jgi:hypothetical protein